MAAKDRTYAKLFKLTLKARNEISASHDLQESINKLLAHLWTQRMKAVASLSSRNATKRADRGVPTRDH